jgi:hypothetical protein
VLFPRMRRKFERLVVLDNLIQVGLVGGGGHSNGETHCE